MRFRVTGKIFLFFSFLAFASCNEYDADTPAEILLTPSGAVFTSEADLSVSVSCRGGWRAELSDVEWFRIDRNTGFGNGTITISLKGATDPMARSATLSVASITDPRLKTSVAIYKPNVDFHISPNAVRFKKGTMEADVAVSVSGAWTAALSDGTWCRIDRTSGTGRGEIAVATTSPTDDIYRSCVLTIASVDYPSLFAEIPVSYSPPAHGRLTVLNKAVKGNGINIVILGDGFTSYDFAAGGKWETTLDRSLSALLAPEPFRSFRDYFNIYAVSAVSPTGLIGSDAPGDTFFGAYYSTGRYILLDDRRQVRDFVREYAPVGSEDLTIAMIVNDTRYGGSAYFESDCGIGITPLNDPYFAYILIHETLGHAFGKLADEYVEFDGAIPAANVKTYMEQKERLGYYQNVEYVDRTEEFTNRHWASFLASGYPGVGVFEGGHTYKSGVWRSSAESVMNGMSGAFNAVSREILVRRIRRSAGIADRYSMDVFREYDQINIVSPTRQPNPIELPPAWYPPI